MKHKIQKVELFVGVIVLLGGLLTYGLEYINYYLYLVQIWLSMVQHLLE